MSVDLKGYENQSFDAVITAVYIKPLRDWLKSKRNPLTDEFIDKKFDLKTVDRENIIVVADCDNAVVDSPTFMVPTPGGYMKSNLKSFIENNELPMVQLPKEAKEWLGKTVKCRLDKNGFLRFAV